MSSGGGGGTPGPGTPPSHMSSPVRGVGVGVGVGVQGVGVQGVGVQGAQVQGYQHHQLPLHHQGQLPLSHPHPHPHPHPHHMQQHQSQLTGMNVPMNQGYGGGTVPGQMGGLSSMSQQNMVAVNSAASPNPGIGPMGMTGGGGMGMVGSNNAMGENNMSNVNSAANTQVGQTGGVGGGSMQQAQPAAQPQQNKEINTASLCRLGQETVQDIVSRTQEVFQALKGIQPPNGTSQGATSSNEKKAKIQEQLRTIRLLFKRLRLIYEKCNENCQVPGMEYTHIESLIPLKEEYEHKSLDEKKTSEAYKVVCEENKELTEQVMLKNKQLKEVINNLRKIIWEINVMLTMRRS